MKNFKFYLVTLITGIAFLSCSGGGSTDSDKSYKNVTTYADLSEYPRNLISDTSGNLYVTADKIIIKIDAIGTISSFSNVSMSYVWGISIDSGGNLYVANFGNDNILKVTGLSGSTATLGGFVISGTFSEPYGTDVYGDILYIADSAANTIIKIDMANSNNRTGFASFYGVYNVKHDSSGNVYASSGADKIIKKYSSDGTLLKTYTIDSTVYPAITTDPSLYDITLDSSGNIFAADYDNCVIWKIDTAGNISLFAGTLGEAGDVDGELLSSKFDNPCGITIDTEGNILIADSVNKKIRKIGLE